MSCNEWERGEWKLPAGEFSALRKTVIAAMRAQSEQAYALAVRYHAALLTKGKGKRGFDYHQACRDLCQGERDGEHFDNIFHGLFPLLPPAAGQPSWQRERAKKPKLPKKKDFKGPAPTEKDFSDDHSGCRLVFNKETKTVIWRVEENNHACDTARDSVLGRVFFAALARVKWTNRTGGAVVGNDEYNRDGEGEGEGGNMTKERYGNQASKTALRRERRFASAW